MPSFVSHDVNLLDENVSLETKRVFRFRAGNPAGANEVLMGTLRQRGMKQIGSDWIRLEKHGNDYR